MDIAADAKGAVRNIKNMEKTANLKELPTTTILHT